MMRSRFRDPVSRYPGEEGQVRRLSRPVAEEDVRAILHGQEWGRTVGSDRIVVRTFVHVEIGLVGSPEVEVRFGPEQRGWTAGQLDAPLATRSRRPDPRAIAECGDDGGTIVTPCRSSPRTPS